jgi:diacylglycerol O-acyltransferase / wax synthase
MTVQSAAQTDRAGPQYRARAHPGAAVMRWAGATHVDEHRRLERLSQLDLSNLRIEDHGLPMHVAALMFLGPAGPSGELDLDTFRVAVERRLPRVPRLRQILHRPRVGLGPPLWIDDPGFDIREHVRLCVVPAPGDEPTVLTVSTELNAAPLDRTRPLWEMWLLTGLAGGGSGLLIRLHHAVADGLAAVAMMEALFAPDPAGPTPDVSTWRRQPRPSTRELVADSLHSRISATAGVLVQMRHPSAIIARLRLLAWSARTLAHARQAPRVSINVPVSGHHRLMLVRADLDRVRKVAHAHGGTVNDVVLTAVAGGAQSLLDARGELTPGLVLQVSVPASLRRPSDNVTAGNRVGIMIVPIRLGDTDPASRLSLIAAATATRKRQPLYQPNTRFLQRWMVRMMKRQHLVNLIVSNVPGPRVPLYVAGARITEIFQIGAVQGNVTISVGAFSYAGRLNLDVVGDPDALPDLAIFAGGVAGTLSQLGALADSASCRATSAGA